MKYDRDLGRWIVILEGREYGVRLNLRSQETYKVEI